MSQNISKIFIASSSELKADRDAFRNWLSAENDRLSKKGIYLKLEQWEYFSNEVSQTFKQDDYNKIVKECDIVICLFYTKAGKYTQSEFDTALKQFKETGKPLIYTYFKEPENLPAPDLDLDEASIMSRKDLISFKAMLDKIGHFYPKFKSIEDLLLQFRRELDKMEEKWLENQVVIRELKDGAIAVYVKKEIKEINGLEEFKALMNEQQVQYFYANDNKFDINGVNESNFGFIIGKVVPTKNIPDKNKLKDFSKNSEWYLSLEQEFQDKEVTCDGTATTTFAYFGWLIEAYLVKYKASCEENPPGLRSLSMLAETYQVSLRFLCFIQLSQIFKLRIEIQHPAITDFIYPENENGFFQDYSNLLIVCTELLKDQNPFVPELIPFVKELGNTKSAIYKISLFLEDIRTKILENKIPEDDSLPTLLDDYLSGLVSWLKKLTFLCCYKMVSIKDVKLEYRLGTDLNFEHFYGELNGNSNNTVQKEGKRKPLSIFLKGKYSYNQSILLLKDKDVRPGLNKIGKDDSFISLSPLIIDMSLYENDPKDTPDIFVFKGMDKDKSYYNFSHFKNEIPIKLGEPITTNSTSTILETDIDKPKRDKLFKDLDRVLKPFKSDDE